MGLNAGRECRGQAYVIGACARDILPKAACSSVCSKCNGRHHKLLCGVQSLSAGSSPNVKGINKHVSMASAEISGTVESLPSVKPSASNATETTSKVILVGSSACVLLQTARVKVRGARGVTEATILFDTGSDRSYVTSELVGKVGPSWVDSQPIAYSGFRAGNTSKAQMRSIFDLILQDEHGSDQSLFATEVPVICAPLVCLEVPQSVLTSFGELSMAWDYTFKFWDQSGHSSRTWLLLEICQASNYWVFCRRVDGSVHSVWLGFVWLCTCVSDDSTCYVSSSVVPHCYWAECLIILGVRVYWYLSRQGGVCADKIWEWLEAGGGALWSHPTMEVGSPGAAPWRREVG